MEYLTVRCMHEILSKIRSWKYFEDMIVGNLLLTKDSLKRTPEYSRPNIKHWKMLECDNPAPTVFDKTAYIKYHFSCTVKSSTKNTRETKSTRQTRKITFESWFWLPKKRSFCRFNNEHYLSPAQNDRWNVRCEFSTADFTPKLTNTNRGKNVGLQVL